MTSGFRWRLTHDSGPLDGDSVPAPTAALSLGEGTRPDPEKGAPVRSACRSAWPERARSLLQETNEQVLLTIDSVNIIDKISRLSVTMSAAFRRPACKRHFPPPQLEGLIEIVYSAMTASQTL